MDKKDTETFAAALQRAREEKEWSQEQLGHMLEVTQQARQTRIGATGSTTYLIAWCWRSRRRAAR